MAAGRQKALSVCSLVSRGLWGRGPPQIPQGAVRDIGRWGGDCGGRCPPKRRGASGSLESLQPAGEHQGLPPSGTTGSCSVCGLCGLQKPPPRDNCPLPDVLPQAGPVAPAAARAPGQPRTPRGQALQGHWCCVVFCTCGRVMCSLGAVWTGQGLPAQASLNPENVTVTNAVGLFIVRCVLCGKSCEVAQVCLKSI